jgi:hypothetical protein
MANYALKVYTPPAVNLIDWVAENPKNAAQVGAGLIVAGAAILILVAIFSS